jgi:predicted MFS family arabinose efflux permease
VAVVVMSGVVAFVSYPVLTLLPLFAERLTGRGIEGYTLLMLFAGAGAMAGTLVAAWLGTFPHMARATFAAAGVLGMLVVGFALSPSAWITYGLLFLVSAGLMLVSSALTSLAQLMVSDDMRGRVMGVYLVSARGGMPLGSLVCGYLASLSSAPYVLGTGGALLCVVSAVLWTRERR